MTLCTCYNVHKSTNFNYFFCNVHQLFISKSLQFSVEAASNSSSFYLGSYLYKLQSDISSWFLTEAISLYTSSTDGIVGNISRNNYCFFQNGSLQYIYHTMFNNWFHYQRNIKWNFLLTNRPLKYKNLFVNLSFLLKVCHTNMTLMKNPLKISEWYYMYVEIYSLKWKEHAFFLHQRFLSWHFLSNFYISCCKKT